MKLFVVFLFIFSTHFVISQSNNNPYFDYYQSMKYFSLGKLDSAMYSINRFEKSTSFDVNGAKLKLKILSELNSKHIEKVFFKLVEKTGIELDHLEYILAKNKDELEILITEEFKENYKLSRRKYLNQLTNISFSNEIEKIMEKDQAIRLLEMEVEYKDTALLKLMEERMNSVDNENFENIKQLIEKHGLPTQEKIGSNQFLLVLMAGMHLSVSSNLPHAYSYFDSVFLETLKIGQFSPEYYMYFKDAVSRKTNNCQIYGYLQFKHPIQKKRSLYTFCNPNESEINMARTKIGAGLIKDQCRFERVYCNYLVN